MNTTIAISNPVEELALPLNGKKRQLERPDFFDYDATERLQLSGKTVENVVGEFSSRFADWEALIALSFLSSEMKARYLDLLATRRLILGL